MADNPFAKYRSAQPVLASPVEPYAEADQRIQERAADRSDASLQLQRQREARDAIESEERRARQQREDALKAEESERLRVAQAAGIADSIYQMRNVIAAAREAREKSHDWFATGFGAQTASGWGGTSAADVEALLNTIGSNTAFDRLQRMRDESPTGGALGAVSERELALLRDSIASLSQTQSDDQFRANMDRVIDSYQRVMGKLIDADRFYRENGSLEGYTPPTEERIAAIVSNEFGNTPPDTPAGFGAETAASEYPPGYNEAHEAYIRENQSNFDPADYVAFRSELDRQYGQGSDPDSYAAWAQEMQGYAADGGLIPPTPTPPERDLGTIGALRNDAISNPYGAFMAGVGNAGGFGIPSLMAGDQMDAMREANPTASLLGEIAGGITGAATGGALLGQAARGVANPRVASLLANPLTADIGYGTIYGATQGDDALTGAAAGATGALAGNVIGSQITRRLPALAGLPRPSNPLNRGEQAVASQISDIDPVADALMAADRLGVPMTGADASAPLNALAGVAARFSPEAGGVARNVMAERNLGQLGRYRQAIQRDLGPIENIPQRSDDLLQQARQQAAPLYEQAYSAPGASSVQIDDLANRPTFKQALQQAYREVADEGLDPMALGFDLNDAGEVVLTRTPSWQTLDYVKRGLDNVIEAETDVINGVTSAGRRATAMKNDLLGRMDSVNPTYAQARAAYAGPAAERQMLREGQLAARESPDQLSLDVTSLSPAQREQMQLGFQSQLSQNAGRVRDNSNPWSQLYTDDAAQRLGTLYPEDSVANLLAQRDLELQLAGSANRLVGNSMTPERLAAEQLFRTNPSSIGGDIAQGAMETAVLGGPWLSVARGAGNRFFRERSQAAANRANTQLGDEVAGILLNPSPTATLDNLTDITRRQAEYEALLGEITNRAAIRGGHAGAGTGSVIAGLLAR